MDDAAYELAQQRGIIAYLNLREEDVEKATIYYDPGDPGYSEYTPGYNATFEALVVFTDGNKRMSTIDDPQRLIRCCMEAMVTRV